MRPSGRRSVGSGHSSAMSIGREDGRGQGCAEDLQQHSRHPCRRPGVRRQHAYRARAPRRRRQGHPPSAADEPGGLCRALRRQTAHRAELRAGPAPTGGPRPRPATCDRPRAEGRHAGASGGDMIGLVDGNKYGRPQSTQSSK